MSRFIDRSFKDAVKALHSLDKAGFQAMMAGGCVRDRLLGVIPKDYDIATDALPDEVMAHFKSQGFKVVPTGIDHGTVTVVMPGGPIEFTTLRQDIETDGRHAIVAFGKSFAEDAARRDFTINAMYEDKGGKIHDFHQGQRHLKEQLLLFVGEPGQRIKEDYLRILRFFRFQARLSFTSPEVTIQAIAANKDGLTFVSQERITSELWQLLGSEHPLIALNGMTTTGVLATVLPELASFATKLPHESVLKTTAVIQDHWRPAAVFGALFQLQNATNRKRGNEILSLAQRLRLPSSEGKRMAFVADLVCRLETLGSETAAALDIIDMAEEAGGRGSFQSLYQPLLAALFRAEQLSEDKGLREKVERVRRIEDRLGHLRTAEMPLKGHDVMMITGLGPGPHLGQLIGEMQRAFRNGAWSTRPEGEAWLQGHFGRSDK